MINSANEYEPGFCATRDLNSKFYKECMSSELLPSRDFAVFERQFLLEYYTERAKHFNMYLISRAL